ncbi:hypothetical protein [Scytonema sp. PRP1]|uniref:hypothetical protein n=1 Tax=Scytonema sp. PRP1 TaxID=3120513 RepID=UPI00300CAE8F
MFLKLFRDCAIAQRAGTRPKAISVAELSPQRELPRRRVRPFSACVQGKVARRAQRYQILLVIILRRKVCMMDG